MARLQLLGLASTYLNCCIGLAMHWITLHLGYYGPIAPTS